MREIKNNMVGRVRAFIARLSLLLKVDMAYVVSGAFWSNANYLFISILSLLTSVLFARYLSKEQYGTYQYVLSLAGMISTATLTGMNTAVMRAVAKGYEGELRKTTRFQLIFGIVPTIISLGIAVWYLFHADSGLSLSLLWVALFLPAANALNTWSAYMGGKKLFRIGTYYSFVNSIVSYGGVIALIYFTHNYIWVAFGNFFFGFLGNLIMYWYTLRKLKPGNTTEEGTIAYGTHLSLMGLPGAIPGQLDALLVYHFVGPAALAIYTFATLLPEKLSGGLRFAQNIALPKFSEKSEESVKRFLIKKMGLMFILIAIVVVLYALAAPWIFHTFFPAYDASIPFTQLYSLSFFGVISTLVQSAIMSQKKTKALYIISFVSPAIRTVLLCVLMYFWGVWGILWAQIIQNFISIPLFMSFLDDKKNE